MSVCHVNLSIVILLLSGLRASVSTENLLAGDDVIISIEDRLNYRLGESNIPKDMAGNFKIAFGLYWKDERTPFTNLAWNGKEWELAGQSPNEASRDVHIVQQDGVAIGKKISGISDSFGVVEVKVASQGADIPACEAGGRLLLVNPGTLDFSQRDKKTKKLAIEIRCSDNGRLKYLRVNGKKVPEVPGKDGIYCEKMERLGGYRPIYWALAVQLRRENKF